MAVNQQMYTCLSIESLGLWFTAQIFMVAQTGIDGSFQSSELCRHILVGQRTDAAIDDVTGNKDKFWLFCIYFVHPFPELICTVMIAQMQVAQHHQPVLAAQMSGRLQYQRYTHFVQIIQISVDKQSGHDSHDGHRSCPAVVKKGTGDKMNHSPQVEYQEQHQQIQADEDGRVAQFV